MSEQDKVKPYHARDAAPGQEAADVVAEVLKHAAERELAAKTKTVPKGPPKWMMPVTLNLGLLAVYFLIAQPQWVVITPLEESRTSEQILDQTRAAMYMDGVTRIQNFRDANGRLPASLEEAGSSLGAAGLEIDYSMQGDDFILMVTVGDQIITWDSATTRPEDFVPNLDGALGS